MGSFFKKITEVAKNFGLLVCTVKVVYLFLTKNGLCLIWGDFLSQIRPVTLTATIS
jgi:hypothetical protein